MIALTIIIAIEATIAITPSQKPALACQSVRPLRAVCPRATATMPRMRPAIGIRNARSRR